VASQPLHLSWFNPVQLTFGAGCRLQIPADVDVVVLADRAALGYDDESALVDALGTRCLAWSWVDGGASSIAHAQTLCAELWPAMSPHPHAVVLALGGGTTLDLAKVIRYRLSSSSPSDWALHWRANSLPADVRRHQLWLIPTTAGTGSEVTPWATVWDTEVPQPVKLSWSQVDGFAERAWVDPELCLSCPPRVTRDCGLDALSHALEAIWNRSANGWTRPLAVHAAQTVVQALPVALGDPRDLSARAQLSHASLLAGLVMSQTHTALAHALSYDLTLHESMPHGEACAVWLPMVWELSLGSSAQCDAALGEVFQCDASSGAHRLRSWLERLGIAPRDLRPTQEGLVLLNKEMRSTRGRNFIAKQP
jgi:alcohol dehydrogenase